MRGLFLGLILLSFSISHSQPGSLDPSFGNHGIVRTDFGSDRILYANDCKQILLNPDGSFYLVVGINGQTFVTRRLADGAIDSSYGESGYSVPVSIGVSRAVIQTDGKIIVGGTSNGDFALARLNSDGSLDLTFSDDGKQYTDFSSGYETLFALTLQDDGKIVAAGQRGDGSDLDDFILARYNADGSPDLSFSVDGKLTTNLLGTEGVFAVAVQNDGKIIATGYSTLSNIIYLAVTRYLPDGNLDSTFSGDGIVTLRPGWFNQLRAICVQQDGKIVVGGFSVSVEYLNLMRFIILRFNGDGTLDTSFSGDGIQYSEFGDASIAAMALHNDGKIVATGFSMLRGYQAFFISRFNVDGSPDNSFSQDGYVMPAVNEDPNISIGFAASLVLKPDGRIMIAGSGVEYAVVRYNPDGTLDNTFDGDGFLKDHKASGNSTYNAVAVQNDGKIVTAGTDMGSSSKKMAIARYHAEGTLDNSFSEDGKLLVEFPPDGAEASALAIQPDGKIVVVGTASNGSNTDFVLIRLNPDGSFDNSFSGDGKLLADIRGYDDGASSVSIQADGKIVVGGYSNIWGADDDFAFARFNTDGSFDNSFSGDGKQTINFNSSRDRGYALMTQPDGKIVLAGEVGFTQFSSSRDIGIARINIDGSPDLSFDGDGMVTTDFSGLSDYAFTGVLQPDGKIVVAGYFDGKFGFARYNSNGSLDNSFSGDGKIVIDFDSVGLYYGFATSIVVQGDGKIVAGGFVESGPINDFAIVRLNADGTPDISFSGDGKLLFDFGYGQDAIQGLAISGNRLYAAGRSTYSGTNSALAAFLINDLVSTSISCPANQETNTEAGICRAVINNIDPVLTTPGTVFTYELTGATNWSGTGSVSGFFFLDGVTNVTYRLANDPTQSCNFTIKIKDIELPRADYIYFQGFCHNNSNNYVLPPLTATDNCGIRNIEFAITGPTSRSGFGNNASGFLSPGLNTIKWTIRDISLNTITLSSLVFVTQPGDFPEVCNQELITGISPSAGKKTDKTFLEVYPNPSPAQFKLTLRSSADGTAEFVVRDQLGRVIEKDKIKTNQMLVVGASYRPGIYFVEVIKGKERFTAKLVKLQN